METMTYTSRVEGWGGWRDRAPRLACTRGAAGGVKLAPFIAALNFCSKALLCGDRVTYPTEWCRSGACSEGPDGGTKKATETMCRGRWGASFLQR